ncbi:2-dehydropantoate 2-reductase [Consotaella salsifontis]|uniref:2-dehydropantoate 2-reductase n=1 Tax=Consotaella salsifontis TaxID=1365950 RepID=A0A1T4SQK8_9HYPH|nr:2-dehydropantoate 2-reductase [Consotaella salsifontis]SKA30515.1 ketopantoate reductase [Consotaella salsifontis]
MKKICIFGAGAIGGAVATRLQLIAQSHDLDVSVVARGAQLAAIREHGLTVSAAGEPQPWAARMRATDDAAELGPQDIIFVALKGHQLTAACGALASLLGPETRLVAIQNGIPWWYFHGDKTSGLEGRRIEMLDPGGELWRRIGPERVIAGVVYQGAAVAAPGDIRLGPIGRFVFGEPNGEMTDDLERVATLIRDAGWQVKTTPRIRDDLWMKLQGNAAFNPLSALTRGTMADLLKEPMLSVVRQIVDEVRQVAEALGARIEGSAEEHIVANGGVGSAKTSMLQDLEKGRRLEYVPIQAAVGELARMVGVATPISDAVLALTTQLDESMARKGS